MASRAIGMVKSEFLDRDDRLPAIVTADLADHVRQDGGLAARTLDGVDRNQSVMGAALSLSRFRNLSLRYGHEKSLFLRSVAIPIPANAGRRLINRLRSELGSPRGSKDLRLRERSPKEPDRLGSNASAPRRDRYKGSDFKEFSGVLSRQNRKRKP